METSNAAPVDLRGQQVHHRLLDGRELLIRAIAPEDKQALQEGLLRLSGDSAYYRFFVQKKQLSTQELSYYTEIDFVKHVALVTVAAKSGLLVGVGRYVRCAGCVDAAEMALVVDDAFQRAGVATALFQQLTKIARAAGIVEFRASVLADNHKMLRWLTRLDLPQRSLHRDGVVEVRLTLATGS